MEAKEYTGVSPEQEKQKEQEKEKDFHFGTHELLDALPQSWTRGTLYVLVSFATLVLPWAILSKVDETGSARGRIEPKGATQKLDSQVSGSVTAVKVKEGETVRTGQVLVEIESNILRTELQQAQTQLSGQVNQKAQLEMLKNQIQLATGVTEQQNQSQELEKIAQINQAQQGLSTKQSNYNLQKLEKQALVDQAKQNIKQSETNYKLVNSRLDRDVSEVNRFRELVQVGAIPQIKVVELEKEAEHSRILYSEAQSNIKQSQLRLKEEQNRYQAIINQARADIEQAKLLLEQEQSGYKTVVNAGKLAVLRNQEQLKDLLSQITVLKSQIGQTRSQIASFKLQLQQRIVKSPVDGVIFELPVTKPGAVVQPGQRIAQVAPKNAGFILKANIPSEHSGFLKVGMPVKIKFDAYPFQEHGIVEGKLTWISPNSKVSQAGQGSIETFELEIALEKDYIQNGNKRIRLTAGQTATAEVIVRQRRIIDFVLDPFKKLNKGGMEI
jgi:hemolysin D